MIASSKTLELLLRLFKTLPKKRKRSLFSLIPLAVLTGLADVVVVGLVSRVFTIFIGQPNKPSLPFGELIPDDPKIKVITLVVIYIAMNWIAAFLRLFLKAAQERLRASIWLDLSELAQKKVLAQPYEFFLDLKSSDLSANIFLNITRVSEKLIRPILQIASGIFVVSFICIAILLIAKVTALYLIFSLLIGYSLISLIVTPFIRFASRQRILLERETNSVLNESIRTILDVHLTGSEPYFEKRYALAGKNAFPFLWKAETLPEFPRALIEPFGITLIFSIGLFPILFGSSNNELVDIVPFLATIAVASLKLTPPLQDIFKGLTDLRGGLPDLEETLKLVELKTKRLTLRSSKVTSPKGIEPRINIKLNNLMYKYPSSKEYVLNNINLNIPIGSRIAFVGKTGSGKSTTANQLLCLLRPTSGSLQLDGVDVKDSEVPSWQACCSYVPQSITLLNNNVIENIAYGVEKEIIDEERIWEALETAQIADLVSELPMGLYTQLGDNGVRLSGGQRQRVALARAFYRKSKFLILDEATSALDSRTEAEVMNAIELVGRRCTIVLIAHRLTTIMSSDCIYEFEQGRIKANGNYDSLISNSESFFEMVNTAKRNIEQDY